jgi:hypothetical protein
MFNAAIFWASVGGVGGVGFMCLAFLVVIWGFSHDEPGIAVFGGGVVGMVGATGVALSLALTGAWS